jgi:hypothetical protein
MHQVHGGSRDMQVVATEAARKFFNTEELPPEVLHTYGVRSVVSPLCVHPSKDPGLA